MAKANRLLSALQWSSTMCCPSLLFKKGLLGCMSALLGVEIVLTDQAIHGISCAAGILDLHHWDAPLGLDGVGLRLIWHGNLIYVEDTSSARPQDRQLLSPFPLHPYLKGPMFYHMPQTADELMILAPEHQLCSKSKAWRIPFLVRWPLLNTFQFVL